MITPFIANILILVFAHLPDVYTEIVYDLCEWESASEGLEMCLSNNAHPRRNKVYAGCGLQRQLPDSSPQRLLNVSL